MLNSIPVNAIPPASYLMLLIVLVYMLPWKKRTGFWWRFPLSAICVLAVMFFRVMLYTCLHRLIKEPEGNGESAKEILALLGGEGALLFIGVLMLMLLFYFCVSVSRMDAAVLAICSYLTMDVYLSILNLLPASGEGMLSAGGSIIIKIGVTAIFFGIVYYLLAVRIIRERTKGTNDDLFLILMACLLLLNHGVFAYHLEKYGHFALKSVMCSVAGGSFIMLLTQVIREQKMVWREKAELEMRMRRQKQADYESMRMVSGAMRHYYHDLKYLLAALEQSPEDLRNSAQIDALRENLALFENTMETGCEALDMVLADAWRRCRPLEVQWTCMAEGAVLKMMDPLDVYIMLGNALDNALESLSAVADPAKRFLFVNIYSREGMALLRIANSCETLPEIRNGFPLTTKKDAAEHGFGLRSIDAVVSRYGGVWTVSAEDRVFTLKIMLPVPDDPGE